MAFSFRNLFSSKSKRRRSGRKTVKTSRCDKLSKSQCASREKKCKWVGKTRQFCRRKVNR